MKAVVAAFNQEKALVGAFSMIVKTDCETDGLFYSTSPLSSVLLAQNVDENIELPSVHKTAARWWMPMSGCDQFYKPEETQQS